jgi:hypothetical protein
MTCRGRCDRGWGNQSNLLEIPEQVNESSFGPELALNNGIYLQQTGQADRPGASTERSEPGRHSGGGRNQGASGHRVSPV